MPDSDLTYETTDITASPAAAAETVIAVLGGVNTRWQNQQIKLSGWVNVTPDASATAVVLRVRRHAIGGALVGLAQTMGLGGAAASTGILGNDSTDVVSADAPVSVPCDGALHWVDANIAAPPAWMDTMGNIILPGLYAVRIVIAITTPLTAPGKLVGASMPFALNLVNPLDGVALGGNIVGMDLQSLAAAALPYACAVGLKAETDVTGVISGLTQIARLASTAALGAGITPADAVTDVVDSPGSLASGSYVLTAQMTGAAAGSTVNGVRLEARVD